MIGTAAIAAAPPSASERRATGPRGSRRSARPSAEPRPDGDAGQDDADDAGERLQRDADVRRQQASGEDLQHQHGAGGDEHERHPPAGHPSPAHAYLGSAARHPRRLRARRPFRRVGTSDSGKHSDGGRACERCGDAWTPRGWPRARQRGWRPRRARRRRGRHSDANCDQRVRRAEGEFLGLLRRYWATTLARSSPSCRRARHRRAVAPDRGGRAASTTRSPTACPSLRGRASGRRSSRARSSRRSLIIYIPILAAAGARGQHLRAPGRALADAARRDRRAGPRRPDHGRVPPHLQRLGLDVGRRARPGDATSASPPAATPSSQR